MRHTIVNWLLEFGITGAFDIFISVERYGLGYVYTQFDN